MSPFLIINHFFRTKISQLKPNQFAYNSKWNAFYLQLKKKNIYFEHLDCQCTNNLSCARWRLNWHCLHSHCLNASWKVVKIFDTLQCIAAKIKSHPKIIGNLLKWTDDRGLVSKFFRFCIRLLFLRIVFEINADEYKEKQTAEMWTWHLKDECYTFKRKLQLNAVFKMIFNVFIFLFAKHKNAQIIMFDRLPKNFHEEWKKRKSNLWISILSNYDKDFSIRKH